MGVGVAGTALVGTEVSVAVGGGGASVAVEPVVAV